MNAIAYICAVLFHYCLSIGVCDNAAGDGHCFLYDPAFNYISYSCVEGIQEGDIVLTIEKCDVYEDGSVECAERWDFILPVDNDDEELNEEIEYFDMPWFLNGEFE